MTPVLLLAVLIGPPPQGATPLKIHLGRDHQSAIIRSELANNHDWFIRRRLPIFERYRVTVDDDANLYPTYQIGDERKRSRFHAGTFAASGSFVLNLAEIGERWIADNRDYFDKSDRIDNDTASRARFAEDRDFQRSIAPPPISDFIPGSVPPPDVP